MGPCGVPGERATGSLSHSDGHHWQPVVPGAWFELPWVAAVVRVDSSFTMSSHTVAGTRLQGDALAVTVVRGQLLR